MAFEKELVCSIAKNRDCEFQVSRSLGPKYVHVASGIRTTFSSGQEIYSGPKLTDCTYLRAVIDEWLRISPASIGTLWRQQDLTLSPEARKKPFIVDGHVIPPKTMVGISPYSLLHNPAYFPEPFEFRSERWLGDEVSEVSRRAFAPFAIGDRSCAGKAVAYLETRLAVARTLWYFDFEKAPGPEVEGGKPGGDKLRARRDEFQLQDVIVADHDGPNLIFKTRRSFWKEIEDDVTVQ